MAEIYHVKSTFTIDELIASIMTNSPLKFEFDDEATPGIIGRVIMITTNEHSGSFFLSPEDELQDQNQGDDRRRTSCGLVVRSEASPELWLEGIYRTNNMGLLRRVPSDSVLRLMAQRK